MKTHILRTEISNKKIIGRFTKNNGVMNASTTNKSSSNMSAQRMLLLINIHCYVKNYDHIKTSVLTYTMTIRVAACRPSLQLSALLQSTQPPGWQSQGRRPVRRRQQASSAMELMRLCQTRPVYEASLHPSAAQPTTVNTALTFSAIY